MWLSGEMERQPGAPAEKHSRPIITSKLLEEARVTWALQRMKHSSSIRGEGFLSLSFPWTPIYYHSCSWLACWLLTKYPKAPLCIIIKSCAVFDQNAVLCKNIQNAQLQLYSSSTMSYTYLITPTTSPSGFSSLCLIFMVNVWQLGE